MTVSKISDIGVAILVFPLAAQNLLNTANKLTMAVSSVTACTFFISGGIPDSIAWLDGVQVCDIGMRLHYLKDKQPVWLSAVLWIGKAITAQILLAREVFRLRQSIDVVICTWGSYYQFPILMARFLNKKVLCRSGGLDTLNARVNYGNIIASLVGFLSWLNFVWSHAVLVDSVRLGESKVLAPFRSKLYDGALFLNHLDRFQVRTLVQNRENLVGYIGRLTAEKGVLEFVRAIPLVLEQQPDLRFLIIGTGRLDNVLEEMMQGQPWASHITWIKWVEHMHIPDYLNRLKLIVVPSYTEGLPNLILEAMGCGTPILATNVGGIPDLVVDGETGFLLEDNSPTTIAQAILRTIKDSRLEVVARQARALIERDYKLDAASERYRIIMSAIMM